jgi:glycosyltransferase involved in cell wall biosynthesis
MDGRLFFSIIIPAHNEELYLERTLEHVRALAYPVERYEVIVVENGSTDGTYELAKRFEGGNVRVLRSEKGVSRAKNLAIDNARKDSDWFVFLDADTVLEPAFLSELDGFLREPHHAYTVGTTSVRPLSGTLKARLWFAFYDLGHRLTKASYSIKMVRRDLFPPVRFEEGLQLAEDLHVIAQARAFGDFFFLPTDTVYTSTRRFDKLGWWYIFFKWTFEAMLPEAKQKQLTYEVIR